MPLTLATTNNSTDFKPCPAGMHVAICNLVADMGLQPGRGMYPDPKQQVYIRWEIPRLRVKYEKDGKQVDAPQVIGEAFTASMNEKARLRKHLESWRGRRFTDAEASVFDVGSILGKACMINVVHNVKGEKTYANIAVIAPLPDGMPKPTRTENELLYYASDQRSQFDKLPEWLKKAIQNPAKQDVSNASGIYTQPEMATQYNYTDKQQDYGFQTQEQPPIEAYAEADNAEQHITDDDIPF